MTAQPHLNLDPQKMWTLDHLKRLGTGAEPERPVQRDDRRGAGGVRRGLQPPGPGRPAGPHEERLSAGQARGRAGPARPSSAAGRCRTATRERGSPRWARSTTSGSSRSGSRSRSTPTRRSCGPPPSRACTLMHGCKEGQCASCKSFVLDGEDIELDSYSTFALPDFERDEGLTLLCRAHAFEDLTIELLNYDEEMIQSGAAAPEGHRRGRRERAGDPRHAPPRGQARRARGDQVLPRPVPGLPGARSRRDPVVLHGEHPESRGRLRVRHPDLPGRAVLRAARRRDPVGDRLQVEGPFGAFRLRRAAPPTCCSSAAARGSRRCWPCCARWPNAASTGRSPSTTARAPAVTCPSRRRSPSSPSNCPA